jgi:hypothetical protein
VAFHRPFILHLIVGSIKKSKSSLSVEFSNISSCLVFMAVLLSFFHALSAKILIMERSARRMPKDSNFDMYSILKDFLT